MKRNLKIALVVAASLIKTSAISAADMAVAPATSYTLSTGACDTAEAWSFTAAVSDAARGEFKATVSGSNSPARGFAEALYWRRVAGSHEARKFSEYWISRALFGAGLPHIAFAGFNVIASEAPQPKSYGPQIAALECLNVLHAKNPSFNVNPAVTARLTDYGAAAHSASEHDTVWKYALKAFMAQPTKEGLIHLRGAGAKESFAQALWSAGNNHHAETIRHLEAILSPSQSDAKGMKQLERYTNQIHLLLSRAYFSTEQFEKAFSQLKLISKSSNELAAALSELSWSALMAEKYGEAIGTAISLQGGGMRRTFAPEAPMVMAMAMNELCQFPESLTAVQTFRKNYETSYRWLSRQQQQDSSFSNLYPQAVDFIRKKSDMPDRVGTEWVRSPTFISSQDEINLISDERDSTVAFARAATKEQRQQGAAIRAQLKTIKSSLKEERSKYETYVADADLMTSKIKAQIGGIKDKMVHYRRFRKAAGPFRSIVNHYLAQSPALKHKLVDRINGDLKERSSRMLNQLIEIAENNLLIEVEIYNGASQDIIWQNAHPDYKEAAKKIHEDQEQHAPAEKVWDWGRSIANDENSEIWEDELGSFKANTFDNCSSKDRYLAIRGKK